MDNQSTNAIVVIPVYKEILNDNERVSLQQCVSILSCHRIFLAAPEGLSLDAYFQFYPNFEVQRFSPKFFESAATYNKLLLSSRFYKRFLFSKYLLIHQLDVYVFRDELDIWCDKGYSYIGAPWLDKPPTTKKRRFFDPNKFVINKVGNGGFSLRNVKSHYWSCLFFKPLVLLYSKNEDFFWSFVAPMCNPFFTKPKLKEGLEFAWELLPQKAFKLNNGKLPFGCHAWEKYGDGFWKQYIS